MSSLLYFDNVIFYNKLFSRCYIPFLLRSKQKGAQTRDKNRGRHVEIKRSFENQALVQNTRLQSPNWNNMKTKTQDIKNVLKKQRKQAVAKSEKLRKNKKIQNLIKYNPEKKRRQTLMHEKNRTDELTKSGEDKGCIQSQTLGRCGRICGKSSSLEGCQNSHFIQSTRALKRTLWFPDFQIARLGCRLQLSLLI